MLNRKCARLCGTPPPTVSTTVQGRQERMRYGSTKSPEAIIKMRYSAMVIDVQRESPDKTSHNVDVNSMDDLAKLAERYNVMILHEVRNHKHVYYVHADGSTYRFSIGKDTDNFPGEMPK